MAQRKMSRAAPVHIGVGLDTARYEHHVAFVGEDCRDAARDFSFKESRDGYEQLGNALRRIVERYEGDVHLDIRLDAAGQYAENLEAYLRSIELAHTLSVGEPKRNQDYRNAHYPKRKADAVDSRSCGRYAVIERPPASVAVSEPMRHLRAVCSALVAQRKQTTRCTNRLHNLLARVFPELALIASDLAAGWVLRLLDKFPTPKQIASARSKSLTAIAHVTAERAEQLQEAARRTVGSLGGKNAGELVRLSVEELRHNQKVEGKLEKLLDEAYDGLGEGAHRQIETIPGIGRRTAAALCATIVSIERFATPAALVNYFGVFPEENTSGKDRRGRPVPRGTMQMSRKGNDLVRGYLWMASQSGAQHNPAVRCVYVRELARGKSGGVALGHCMRKLLHLVFALWKTNRPFDPEHYPWEPSSPAGSAQPDPTQPVATAEGLDADRTLAEAEDGKTDFPLATRCSPGAENAPASGESTSSDAPRDHALSCEADGTQPVAAPRGASGAGPAEIGKTAAGHNEGIPQSKVVTAADFPLATRSLSPGAAQGNSAPDLTVEAASRSNAPSMPRKVWVDFAHVRKQITMQQILCRLGFYDRLRGGDAQRRGPCPLHGSVEDTGRPFSVNLTRGIFRCLAPACGQQGNVLDLWAAVHGLELREAAIDLAQTFGLELALQRPAGPADSLQKGGKRLRVITPDAT